MGLPPIRDGLGWNGAGGIGLNMQNMYSGAIWEGCVQVGVAIGRGVHLAVSAKSRTWQSKQKKQWGKG
jgi:hypothetical protein